MVANDTVQEKGFRQVKDGYLWKIGQAIKEFPSNKITTLWLVWKKKLDSDIPLTSEPDKYQTGMRVVTVGAPLSQLEGSKSSSRGPQLTYLLAVSYSCKLGQKPAPHTEQDHIDRCHNPRTSTKLYEVQPTVPKLSPDYITKKMTWTHGGLP